MRRREKKSNTFKYENQLSELIKSILNRIDLNSLIVNISEDINHGIKDTNFNEISAKSKYDIRIFSEELYVNFEEDIEKCNILNRVPNKIEIFEFLQAFIILLNIDIGCIISSYIYMKRFLIFTNVPLHLSTWRPLIFISLIIANKVLYDNNYQIEDFVTFYPFFTIEQVTWMEKKYLEFIDYKLF